MKINHLSLLLMIALSGCFAKNKEQVKCYKPFIPTSVNGDTVRIDAGRSSLHWKGTKMRGLGKLEGTIDLLQAQLFISGNQLTGGTFKIDMNSIDVTDIPEHEPVPRRNLINHLKSDEFFDVDRFPTAELNIISCQTLPEGVLKIAADLRIKDTTHQITFDAIKDQNMFSSSFEIDRFLWDIAYTGSWANRTLVDRMIEFDIKLIEESADNYQLQN